MQRERWRVGWHRTLSARRGRTTLAAAVENVVPKAR